MFKKTVAQPDGLPTQQSDYQSDRQELSLRVKQAQECYKHIPENLSPAEYEFLDVFDTRGNAFGRVNLWAAGRTGVRHKTANAILITPDNKIVSQLRSKNSFLFPHCYSLSAGGHMSYANVHAPSISPRQTIVKELREELGLAVRPERFQCLGSTSGIPNSLKLWVYAQADIKLTLAQFDGSGSNIGVTVKSGHPKQELIADLKKAIIHNRTMVGLQRECWNEEICHYYTVRVTDAEIQQIFFADGEVSGFKQLPVEQFIAAGQDLDSTTDNLYSLFYNREDIARELIARVHTP